MPHTIPVIDLFSGPGGLAEGFSALKGPSGSPGFKVVLSIEMEPTAHRTLLLRSFLRKVPTKLPSQYYEFLKGDLTQEPKWADLYPQEWQEACDETRCLTLGTPEASSFVSKRIAEIRAKYGGQTVLLGGPPCQSYSTAGRGRNAGNADYDSTRDKRHSLYQEYANVLAQLKPAVAVMENVRGMLSARYRGQPIFPEIMNRLSHAGDYRLHSLVSACRGRAWGDGLTPNDFLVRAEQHGIPQKRHRVFVVCVRSDIASVLPRDALPVLDQAEGTVSVQHVIGAMPKLRSRLSYDDSDASWQKALARARRLVLQYMPKMSSEQVLNFRRALNRAQESATGTPSPYRGAQGGTSLPSECPTALRDWLCDPNLTSLPNNETRGHIRDDLARYLFATAYAGALRRSPRAQDFPSALAANHRSWNMGDFQDRFRVQLKDYPSTTVTTQVLGLSSHF